MHIRTTPIGFSGLGERACNWKGECGSWGVSGGIRRGIKMYYIHVLNSQRMDYKLSLSVLLSVPVTHSLYSSTSSALKIMAYFNFIGSKFE